MRAPPYLRGIRLVADRVEDEKRFPFDLPFVQNLDLALRLRSRLRQEPDSTRRHTALGPHTKSEGRRQT